MFAGNNLTANFLGAFLNLATITFGLKVLKGQQHNELRMCTQPLYPPLFRKHCMCKGSRRANASNLACLGMLLGEKMRRHEMALCDFWLREFLSSIQRHGPPEIKYVDLTLLFHENQMICLRIPWHCR